MNDLISVIVPVYNVELYLSKCLDSILEQEYDNMEIILVDDGSTDNSGNLCDFYANKSNLIKVIHKKNGGLSDARNVGIDNSNGEYLVFIDSDDFIDKNLIKYLHSLIKKYDADISICDPVHCYPNKEVNFDYSSQVKVFTSEEAICEMLYQKSFLVSAWAKMYKRKCFLNMRFPFGQVFEDEAIMYKLFDYADKIVYGNAKLYGYLHRENSITTKAFSNVEIERLKNYDNISKYMEGRSENLRKAAKAYQCNASLRFCLNAPPRQEYAKEINKCDSFIKKESKNILKDQNIRRKLRIGIILYLYGKKVLKVVHRKTNPWKI